MSTPRTNSNIFRIRTARSKLNQAKQLLSDSLKLLIDSKTEMDTVELQLFYRAHATSDHYIVQSPVQMSAIAYDAS